MAVLVMLDGMKLLLANLYVGNVIINVIVVQMKLQIVLNVKDFKEKMIFQIVLVIMDTLIMEILIAKVNIYIYIK